MGTVLVNYSGKTRKATINGREYIVAKATLIVPGVLNGSKGALYYPPEEIAKNFDAWNGIPLTNGHPAVSGNNVSARNPAIIQSHGLGHVYNVNITKNGRLRGEAWFDVKSCERVRPEILNKLNSGEPIELSTGLFTNNVPANNGAHHNGRQYTHVARDYRPDHLAILLDQQGACSLRDGCGVLTDNTNEMHDFDESGVCVKCKGRVGSPKCSSKPTGNAMAHTLNAAGFCINCGGKGGKPGPCPSGDVDRTPEPVYTDKYVKHYMKKIRKYENELSTGKFSQSESTTRKRLAEAKSFLEHSLKQLEFDRRLQEAYQSRTSQNPTDNSHSGDDMATKKEKMVAFLTANCDCWKGEKDAEILSNFDEDKLKTLIAATKEAITNSAAINEIKEAFGAEADGLTVNAMPAFVKGKALAKAPPEEMEDAEEEPAESEMEEVVAPPAKKGKKKMPVVANSSTARPEQPPTLNEWLASAPVEVQEVIRTAQAVEQGAKEKIVKTLVGNSSARTKDDRASLAKFLMTKPLAELNTLSKLSVNRASAPAARDPMAFLEAPAKPAPTVNYAGLGEDFDDDEPTANEDTVLDAPLGCPTANVDWAAEAKLIPTGAHRNK